MGKRLVNGKTSPAQVVDELHDAPAQCRRAAQGADECDGLHSQVLLRGFSVLYRGYSPKKTDSETLRREKLRGILWAKLAKREVERWERK